MVQVESEGGDGEMTDSARVLHCLCISVASGHVAISLSCFFRGWSALAAGSLACMFFFFIHGIIYIPLLRLERNMRLWRQSKPHSEKAAGASELVCYGEF